jgi:hypothetical protein
MICDAVVAAVSLRDDENSPANSGSAKYDVITISPHTGTPLRRLIGRDIGRERVRRTITATVAGTQETGLR